MKCPRGSISDGNGKCISLCREPVYQKNDKGICVMDITTFIIFPLIGLFFISLLMLLLFKRSNSVAQALINYPKLTNVHVYVIVILTIITIIYAIILIIMGRTKEMVDLVEFKYATKSIYFDKNVARSIGKVVNIIENEFNIDLKKYTISTTDCNKQNPVILSLDKDVSSLGALYYICPLPI